MREWKIFSNDQFKFSLKLAYMKKLIGILFCLWSFTLTAAPQFGVFRLGEAFLGDFNYDQFEQWLGRPVQLVQGHQDVNSWEDVEGGDWQLNAYSRYIKGHPGKTLNYTITMFPKSYASTGLARCAAGEFDSHYQKLADRIVLFGLQNSILRVGHEFSGNWQPWSAIGQEKNFVNCFRRVVQVIRARQPNANLKFDWNPNYDIPQAMFDTTYPGDDVVDFIGIDMYDLSWIPDTYPVPATCTGQCRTDRELKVWNSLHRPALERFVTFSKLHKKPLSFPEWGLAYDNVNGGGDNVTFVAKILEFILNPANNVAYHNYFDAVTPVWDHQISNVSQDGKQTHVTKLPKGGALIKKILNPPVVEATINMLTPATQQTQSGRPIDITYSFNSEAQAKSYKVFVHIQDSTNKTVYQDDHYPAVLTTEWNGDITYNRTLKVPANLPNGSYRIVAGLYEGSNRLPLKVGAGVVEVSKGSYSYVIGQFIVDNTPMVNLSTPSIIESAKGRSFSVNYNFESSALSKDYKVFVHFLDSAGKMYFQNDHTPPVPTTQWSGLISYAKSVMVPSTLPNGEYKILIGLWDGTARLPLRMGSGVTTMLNKPNAYVVGSLKIDNTPTVKQSASVSNIGVRGKPVTLNYSFDGVPMDQDYKVFVHMKNSSGATVFQNDHMPVVPTSKWNGPVSYSQTFTIPSTVAVASYKIVIGVYSTSTGIRQTLRPGTNVSEYLGQKSYIIGDLNVQAP